MIGSTTSLTITSFNIRQGELIAVKCDQLIPVFFSWCFKEEEGHFSNSGEIEGNLVIYRSVVGARLGHGWGKNPNNLGQGWGKNSNNLGQGWGMVGAQGMVGARLGHG